MPSSRRAAHTISVTKRCLALENQVSLLKHEAGVAELRHQRVAEELERARAALGDSNSPYLLLEKGIAQRDDEIQRLKDRVRIGEAELAAAQRTAAALAQDVKVMYAHRAEVLRLRDALRGAAAAGSTTAAAAADGGEMDAAIARAAAAMSSSSSSPAAASDGKKKKKGAADSSAVSVGGAAATAPEDGYFEFN